MIENIKDACRHFALAITDLPTDHGLEIPNLMRYFIELEYQLFGIVEFEEFIMENVSKYYEHDDLARISYHDEWSQFFEVIEGYQKQQGGEIKWQE